MKLLVVRFGRWLAMSWNYLSVKQWEMIDEEIAENKELRQKERWRAAIILCWAAVALTVQEYSDSSGAVFYRWFMAAMPRSDYEPVYRHIYWAVSCSAAYFLFPAVVILLTPGARFRDYGLRLKGFWSHAWIYVILFLLVLPAVVVVSYSASFQRTYPFYYRASRSFVDLGLWWFFYGIQFFFLEFFFRGYLLHGTKKALGALSIFVAAVPYCMIHFGKPMPETLGAIIAGIVLGTLSLRTRSIWSGFLIHISVAFSMDFLSMWQKGEWSIFFR